MAALGGKSLFLLSEEGGRYRRLLSAWPSGGLASSYQDVADSSVRAVAPQLQVLHLSTRRPSGGTYWNTLGGFLVAGGGSQDVSLLLPSLWWCLNDSFSQRVCFFPHTLRALGRRQWLVPETRDRPRAGGPGYTPRTTDPMGQGTLAPLAEGRGDLWAHLPWRALDRRPGNAEEEGLPCVQRWGGSGAVIAVE